MVLMKNKAKSPTFPPQECASCFTQQNKFLLAMIGRLLNWAGRHCGLGRPIGCLLGTTPY